MTSSIPLNSATTLDHWIDWIEGQPVSGWRIVTLKYQGWSRKETWLKPIELTMCELDHTFLKGSLRTRNIASGATKIRRVVALGGDRAAGVKYHVHCLIDGLGDDAKFDKRLQTSWANNVRKVEGDAFREDEATIYSRPAKNGIEEYVRYIVRHEGTDLRFGVDKIEVLNTYLTPSTSRRNLTNPYRAAW